MERNNNQGKRVNHISQIVNCQLKKLATISAFVAEGRPIIFFE
jgi:hypothetical protein